MVSRPLIAQGYSLAEEVANSISHGIGPGFWDCRLSVIAGTGSGYQRQRDGHYQLQPVWREYDPAFPRPQRCITLFRINGRRYGSRNLTTALSIFLLRVPIRRFCWWGSTHRCRVA